MQTWAELIEDINSERVKINSDELADNLIRKMSINRRGVSDTPYPNNEDISLYKEFTYNELRYREKEERGYRINIIYPVLNELLNSPICELSKIKDNYYNAYGYYFIFNDDGKVIAIFPIRERDIVVFEDNYIFSERKSIFIFNRKSLKTLYKHF